MGRRSDHSREELARLVVTAAGALLAAEGAAGVTMRAIGARIGYAPGSIYNAVGDLEAVLLEVHAGVLEDLGAALDGALSRIGGSAAPTGRAVILAETYMAFVAAHAPAWASLLDRPPPADQPVPTRYAAARQRLVEIVASTIAPFYPDPFARRRAVVALWAALQGVATLSAGGNLAFASIDLDPTDIARSIVLRYLTGREDGRDR